MSRRKREVSGIEISSVINTTLWFESEENQGKYGSKPNNDGFRVYNFVPKKAPSNLHHDGS